MVGRVNPRTAGRAWPSSVWAVSSLRAHLEFVGAVDQQPERLAGAAHPRFDFVEGVVSGAGARAQRFGATIQARQTAEKSEGEDAQQQAGPEDDGFERTATGVARAGRIQARCPFPRWQGQERGEKQG